MTTHSLPLRRVRFGHTLLIGLVGLAVAGLAVADVTPSGMAAAIAAVAFGTFVLAALLFARRPPHVITGMLALLLYPAFVPLALVAAPTLPGAALSFGATLLAVSLIGALFPPLQLTADLGQPLVGLRTYRVTSAPRASVAMAAAALIVVSAVAFFRTDNISALGVVAGGSVALLVALWARAGGSTLDATRPQGFVVALGALWSAPPVALFSAMTGRYVLVPARAPASLSEG